MKTTELAQALANYHNMIADVEVKGDNAIIIGDFLKGMRTLVKTILKDGIENDINNGGDS